MVRVWICLFGLVVVGACVGALDSDVFGQLTVEGTDFADFTVEPTWCQSGEWQGFFGADLVEGDSGSDRLIRVVQDPIDGPTLGINIPGEDRAIIVDGTGCDVFEVEVFRQNSRVNEIWNISGSIDIECIYIDGRIEGTLDFSNCH